MVEGWNGGGMEWWKDGMVEGWNGGGMEWWRGGMVEAKEEQVAFLSTVFREEGKKGPAILPICNPSGFV